MNGKSKAAPANVTTSLPLPPAPPIDALRLKLVQLIDQITSLSTLILHHSYAASTSASAIPSLPSFADLLARSHLLLAHFISISGLLKERNGEGDHRMDVRDGRGRDLKVEKWSGRVVVPGVNVEESKDWIVGMLLRTKQTPQVEANIATLQSSLPAQFLDPTTYDDAVSRHIKLTTGAYESIRALSERNDRDWKERVKEIDEDDDDEDQDEGGDKDIKMDEAPEIPARKWTLQEAIAYQRNGIMPS